MIIERRIWQPTTSAWLPLADSPAVAAADLVLVFSGRKLLEEGVAGELAGVFPGAAIVALSTAGEIHGGDSLMDGAILTAIEFENTAVRAAMETVTTAEDSYAAGGRLAAEIVRPGLRHVLVFSDGGIVNGSALARGMNERMPPGVLISGGMAGDGPDFARTLVGLDGRIDAGGVVAVGFYGDALEVVCGSEGGFRAFGLERIATRAAGNVLYELDHTPALEVFKRYLGDAAEELPGSSLRFPLLVYPPDGSCAVVRTILTIDDESGSMVFAGDVPEGSRIQFMHGSYEGVIDGAATAALPVERAGAFELVLCVSCVGRRMLLGQQAEDELDAIRMHIGEGPVMIGFYSYGELAGGSPEAACVLQNQTMTLTALRER